MSASHATAPRGAPPYLPIDGSAWRLSMGLRRLDLSTWLEIDERRLEELERKAELLESARTDVLATLPSGDEASAELLDLVLAHLDASPAVEISHDASGVVTEAATGAAVDLRAMHPIEASSRLVQEDLCVLQRGDGGWRLTAACVCFPSRWRLADKIGRSLTQIHGPVPGFDKELAPPAGTFFDRLAVERPVWRLNWTLLDTAELHLPHASSRRSRGVLDGDLGAGLWFRVERQTLRRMERSGAIVFTIRTYVTSLGSLVRANPGTAAALRATLATVDPEVAAYKGWTDLIEPVMAWLDECAAPS